MKYQPIRQRIEDLRRPKAPEQQCEERRATDEQNEP